jgi:colanic acid biosynthesis glycosyl transferase WcaI
VIGLRERVRAWRGRLRGVRRGRGDARPRILVLTQYYHPEPNFVTQDVARALAEGADVTVVTAHPNYPLGRFYPGTRWWWPARERDGAVTVWRLPLFPDRSSSPLRRILSYLSFTAAAALVAPFVAGRPAVVWVYHTPFTTALAGLWFRYARRARLVFTCADLWPESFTAAGVAGDGPVVRLALAFRRFINRRADLIVCSTEGTRERFAAEGIGPDRLSVVRVWVQGVKPGGESAESPPTPTLVYAGNLGPAQQLESVVRGARLLLDRGVRVRVDLYGQGTAAAGLAELARAEGATNVAFPGSVPPADAFRALSTAAGQIVCLRRSALFRMTVPSKLCAAFAAGTPILFGLEGEAAELVRRSGGGFEFDPERPASFADAVEALLSAGPEHRASMREGLLRTFREEFDRERHLRSYRELLLPGTVVRGA